jgi:hypothetical protein
MDLGAIVQNSSLRGTGIQVDLLAPQIVDASPPDPHNYGAVWGGGVEVGFSPPSPILNPRQKWGLGGDAHYY